MITEDSAEDELLSGSEASDSYEEEGTITTEEEVRQVTFEEESDESEESEEDDTDEERAPEELTAYEAPRYTNCVCGEGLESESGVVWCEMCPKGYHLSCIPGEGVQPVQGTEWFCPECALKRHHKYGMVAESCKKVLVGADHQAPYLPPIFFLSGISYEPARPPPKQVWCAAEGSKVQFDEYLTEAKNKWPLNLFVKAKGPLIQRTLRRAVFARKTRSDEKDKQIRGDIYTCPYSADLALSLLAYCGYEPGKALHMLVSREFKKTFKYICSPPREPYRNKWHPMDRRWKLHKTPFPGKSGPLATPDYQAGSGLPRERRYARLQALKK